MKALVVGIVTFGVLVGGAPITVAAKPNAYPPIICAIFPFVCR